MPKKKNYKCLLVKTKDKRNFFTDEKHLPRLIEFSKTFGAEISVVQAEEAEVLNLVQLGTAICNTSYAPVIKPNYEIIETKVKSKKNTSQEIRKFINKTLLSGNVVSSKEIIKKFGASPSCVSIQIKAIKQKLEKDGLQIKNISRGKFQKIN
jgi:hypothetical protein